MPEPWSMMPSLPPPLTKHVDMTDHRTNLAVCNNADWYAMMFDIHGLRYFRSEIAFVAIDPPPYHSWITSIAPTAQTQQLQLIKQNLHQSRFGVKDSFP